MIRSPRQLRDRHMYRRLSKRRPSPAIRNIGKLAQYRRTAPHRLPRIRRYAHKDLIVRQRRRQSYREGGQVNAVVGHPSSTVPVAVARRRIEEACVWQQNRMRIVLQSSRAVGEEVRLYPGSAIRGRVACRQRGWRSEVHRLPCGVLHTLPDRVWSRRSTAFMLVPSACANGYGSHCLQVSERPPRSVDLRLVGKIHRRAAIFPVVLDIGR